jgi:hypothetical protein
MTLSTATRRRRPLIAAAPARRRRPRDAASEVHAFADRLLYGGWLEDDRRDQVKLCVIRAIAEWARAGAPG